MRNFEFQQEPRSGWVFAKDIVNNNIFLFGPDVEDVKQQAAEAEAFLALAKRAFPPEPVSWKNLQVAS